MKKQFLMIISLFIFFSVHCLGANKLKYPTPEVLVPGETKYEQVIKKFGKPKESSTKTDNQDVLTNISYTESGKFRNGFLPMRYLAVYFKNDIVIGYDWYSSFKEDSTDFDETKISQIIKGETTWQEAAAILNCNYGVYIYPRTNDPNEQALVYMFIQYRNVFEGLKARANIYTKSLTITYGPDDIVTDFAYETSGEKQ